jgi:isopentenyl-diphosphate delta-isomerase
MSTTQTTTLTENAAPITAQQILRLFPDIDTSSDALTGHDAEQIRLMDEVCIVIDENDLPVGNFSKKICKFADTLYAGQSLNFCRPSFDQYREGTSAPRLLRLPLQLQE